MRSLSRRDREATFKKVCRLVETKHFNPKLNCVDWESVVEARRDRILRIESPEEFEKEMHELVSQLKTSHTGCFHQSARRIPARFAINATFQRCQTSDGERWMFLNVHEGGPAHRKGRMRVRVPPHNQSEWSGVNGLRAQCFKLI